MANVKLLFCGSEESETQHITLETFCNSSGEISIFINEEGYPKTFIVLDKSTAIRFAKELRKQIAIID
jgi:hypothetical protein